MTHIGTLHGDVGLVVAAAGASRRFGPGRDKLLESLAGLPVLVHCLRRFAPLLRPEHIVVVVPANREPQFRAAIDMAGIPGPLRTVPGGASRQDSVLNGILALPATATLVAIHDAARPFASAAVLAACIASARDCGSGVAARRVTDTIKVAGPDGRVIETPARQRLWAAETPQVFRRQLIETALHHAAKHGLSVTDDAQAVELLGEAVFLVEHSEENRKLTFAHDLPGHDAETP